MCLIISIITTRIIITISMKRLTLAVTNNNLKAARRRVKQRSVSFGKRSLSGIYFSLASCSSHWLRQYSFARKWYRQSAPSSALHFSSPLSSDSFARRPDCWERPNRRQRLQDQRAINLQFDCIRISQASRAQVS